MNSRGWPRETIESLISTGAIIGHKDGNYGSLYPRVEEFGSVGVPFLTARSIVGGTLDIDGAPRLADDRADALRFGFVQPCDVLLSHNATIGRVAIVPDFDGRLLVGTSLTYFRLNPERLSVRYFAAYLASVDFQNQLNAVMSHSTRNQVPITAQRKLSVVVPPLSTQNAIAGVVGALGDKIEQNRRTARALERLARAMFRAWFVDFEPVKAKAAGATAFPSVPQPVFDALPTRFVESGIGPVPDGWNVRALSSMCTVVSGGTPRRSEETYWNGDIPWYSVKDAPGAGEIWVIRTAERITAEGAANSAARVVPKGCTIISARGTVGKLAMAGVSMAFNQSCYGLLPGDGRSFGHLNLLVHTVVADLQQRSHGSVFDTITRATLDGLLVTSPQGEVVTAFESVVDPMLQLLLALVDESSKLAEVRDYLLPGLLSGQVRVEIAHG